MIKKYNNVLVVWRYITAIKSFVEHQRRQFPNWLFWWCLNCKQISEHEVFITVLSRAFIRWPTVNSIRQFHSNHQSWWLDHREWIVWSKVFIQHQPQQYHETVFNSIISNIYLTDCLNEKVYKNTINFN